MQLQEEDELYKKQWGMAGTLYECQPNGFNKIVTAAELEALETYYLLGREVDVENIYDYRRKLKRDNPELVKIAEKALQKILEVFKVPLEKKEQLFHKS